MALSPCGSTADRRGRELVTHGTPLFPLACYLDDFQKDTVPWHWHDELELIRVETGAVVVAVEGETRSFGPGDGCFINAGALHSAWAAERGPCRHHALVFHPRLIGGVDTIFWQKYVQPLLSDAACRWVTLGREVPWQREALDRLEDAWQTCRTEPPGYEFGVRSALSEVILALTEHRPAVQGAPSARSLRDGERMKRMLHYVEEHYDQPLTVEDIARSASVSESECLRCFRRVIGAAPMQYLKQLRLQRAAELLADTDRQIADIGALCGFQEMSYFARSFRAFKGVTPSVYRQQARK